MEANNMKQLMLTVMMSGALLLPAAGLADEIDPYYAGFGLGLARMQPDTEGSGYSVDNEYDTGYKLYGGYRVDSKLAVELYYADLGDVTLKPAGHIGYQDYGVAGIYHVLRQGEHGFPVSAYVRVGIGSMRNQTDVYYERDEDYHLLIGAGIEYNLGNGLAVRADADLFDHDSNLVSVSLVKYFGARPAQQVVPPVPEPQPEPVRPADDDGDGIANETDACPGTPTGQKVDAVGCELKLEIELKGVVFENNSAKLLDESTTVLNQAAETLLRYPELKVEVAGYTDSRGSAVYNQRLSENRALAVRQFLVDKGVDAERLTAKGYGEDDPVADNATAAGRKQNRRVILRLLDEKPATE